MILRLIFIGLLSAISFSVQAQQGTVQKAAATIHEQPKEISSPANTTAELRSVTAPTLDGQAQSAPGIPSSSGENHKNTAAELPKREKSIDD